MALKDELQDLIYRSVFTAVIALFIFFEIYNYVDFEVISGGNIFSVILISLSYNALYLIYRKVHFYIFPALFAVGFLLWLASDKRDIEELIGGVSFSFLIIGLAAFVIFMICDRVVLLGILASAGIFVFMLVELFMGYDVYKASPALAAFYALSVLTRFLRDGLKTGNPARTRKYITFLLPFLLLYLILLAVWPKPETPVSWEWVERLYENASKKITLFKHRLSSQYGVIDSGYFRISFGMNEHMNYDNSEDDGIELFEITPSGNLVGSLYLKGEIFNEFSGGEWHNTLESSEDYFMTDSLETRGGVEKYDDVPGNSLLREAAIRVKFLDIVSPIVFTPAKTLSFTNISTRKKTQAVNEHLLFDGNVSYGGEYAVSFLQLNLGNTVFADYMNAPISEDPDIKGLAEYREYINTFYTSVPAVRESVHKWIEAVTADAVSDYEKLLAVEQALSGFAYNIETEKMPDYVQSEGDFIDHFILEKREGFCIHYATAFCLIARYMGFPSRVIHGYKTDINGNTVTIISDECSHSWPEVYFRGKGWIPFEPTPGMGGERYDGWTVKSGKIKDQDSAGAKPRPEIPLPEEDTEYIEEHDRKTVSWILMLAIAGVILLSVLILLAVRILMRRIKLKKMNVQEKYYHEYDMVILTLKELGIKRIPDETIAEFAERSGIPSFEICAAIHEGCIYGGKIPTEDNTAALVGCRKELGLLMKEKFGRTLLLHRLKLLLEEGRTDRQ